MKRFDTSIYRSAQRFGLDLVKLWLRVQKWNYTVFNKSEIVLQLMYNDMKKKKTELQINRNVKTSHSYLYFATEN